MNEETANATAAIKSVRSSVGNTFLFLPSLIIPMAKHMAKPPTSIRLSGANAKTAEKTKLSINAITHSHPFPRG